LALTPLTAATPESLRDDVRESGSRSASRAASPHRLLYATPVLREPLHLSGSARITVRLRASTPAANLSVWLVQLPYDSTKIGSEGRAGVITRGWADPQNYRSLIAGGNYSAREVGEPLVAGRFYTLTFDLQPDDQIIPAGAQLGLMIMSSDREFTLWPAPGTVLTVDLAGTTLSLPVVGGREALVRAVGLR
jgi:X-Pro dipeptidyl-peptidase